MLQRFWCDPLPEKGETFELARHVDLDDQDRTLQRRLQDEADLRAGGGVKRELSSAESDDNDDDDEGGRPSRSKKQKVGGPPSAAAGSSRELEESGRSRSASQETTPAPETAETPATSVDTARAESGAPPHSESETSREPSAAARATGVRPTVGGRGKASRYDKFGRDSANTSACSSVTSGADRPTLRDGCLLYTSPSPRDKRQSRMPSSA